MNTPSVDQLVRILKIPPDRAQLWYPHLATALAAFGINTPLRVAHFLAQVGHESGGFRYTKEIWTNSSAQQSYEGAKRLGNTEPGDGERFMGRSPIQLTGRRNYTLASQALGVDLVAQPHLAERPDIGMQIAAWFWTDGAGQNLGRRAKEVLKGRYGMGEELNLNVLADLDDVEAITYCVNGGLNGYQHRCEILQRARNVFVSPVADGGEPLTFEVVG